MLGCLGREEMGCASSRPKRYSVKGKCKSKSKRKSLIPEVAVFVPALRVPLPVDLIHALRGLVSRDVLDKLSTLRGRLIQLSAEDDLLNVSRISQIRQALEEYLPVLLGLTNKEKGLDALVQFKWKNLEDDEEFSVACAWYEVLSVVHAMAMLSLLEANSMLLPRETSDGSERKVSEDSKKDVVDLLIKASGCLEYCVHHILVQIPIQVRKNLPSNLQQGTLEAICIQTLGQGVEMQLGLASESDKATLSVKRRLACELVAYFSQAHYILSGCDTSDSYGKKLLSLIKWKFLEAKAAAYYYHGLVVDKGNEPSCHISAVCCLCTADDLLNESKRVCLSFCLATPVTRVPAPWGVMKHLHKKIPDVAYKRSQMYAYLFEQDKNATLQSLPDLPEFQLSLRPEPYELPNADHLWESEDCGPQIQSLKDHLEDEDEHES
ncbi:Endosomal targeting BRO1-like domain-containing protein [Rhynchospora pubera]|uniref:Endosomal targeting BRO1-like domain-containing protein n=2 Tax=Rhynchospora pubera TaxID=906938 RepID=A0AAV8ARM2_9POAL|nr:Endosomal targeting BRO1-like domain-containing protein [Rhynchospora pubera]